jgi:hypothetical protein
LHIEENLIALGRVRTHTIVDRFSGQQRNIKSIDEVELITVDKKTGRKSHDLIFSLLNKQINNYYITDILLSPYGETLTLIYAGNDPFKEDSIFRTYEVSPSGLLPLTGGLLNIRTKQYEQAKEVLLDRTNPSLPRDLVEGSLHDYMLGTQQDQEQQMKQHQKEIQDAQVPKMKLFLVPR